MPEDNLSHRIMIRVTSKAQDIIETSYINWLNGFSVGDGQTLQWVGGSEDSVEVSIEDDERIRIFDLDIEVIVNVREVTR